MRIIEKKFMNNELKIELVSYIDAKQNIWFRGKDVAKILGYTDTDDALRRHVSEKYKKEAPGKSPGAPVKRPGIPKAIFISEPGYYELVSNFGEKLRDWVFSQVFPFIRKYGQYKLFDNPNNQTFKIGNETDLHYKAVQYIRRFYPEAIIIAGLGENQDTATKRINSWRKGYMKGQSDIIIANQHEKHTGLWIEFKSPTNNYKISEAQNEMKERFQENNYRFLISNDYEKLLLV